MCKSFVYFKIQLLYQTTRAEGHFNMFSSLHQDHSFFPLTIFKMQVKISTLHCESWHTFITHVLVRPQSIVQKITLTAYFLSHRTFGNTALWKWKGNGPSSSQNSYGMILKVYLMSKKMPVCTHQNILLAGANPTFLLIFLLTMHQL